LDLDEQVMANGQATTTKLETEPLSL
jgi:hypothetical protein